ncbi:MAG: chalcone isomerase family protein [Betaproteobacteria bacterium]|nr:chalcone isomerase family protein [Betaproteobacteria bacterium]
MKRWRLIPILLALLTGNVLALPDPVRAGRADWREWGSGEMTWFGFALYRATLWVSGQDDGVLREGVPLALALEYRRDIPGERIVRASVDEMRKLGATEAQLQGWEAEMRRVFPDVKKGDVLTGVLLPGQGARFFHQNRLLGDVTDAAFARTFFAIWLDPKTSAPDVRLALLRLKAD